MKTMVGLPSRKPGKGAQFTWCSHYWMYTFIDIRRNKVADV